MLLHEAASPLPMFLAVLRLDLRLDLVAAFFGILLYHTALKESDPRRICLSSLKIDSFFASFGIRNNLL